MSPDRRELLERLAASVGRFHQVREEFLEPLLYCAGKKLKPVEIAAQLDKAYKKYYGAPQKEPRLISGLGDLADALIDAIIPDDPTAAAETKRIWQEDYVQKGVWYQP